MAKDRLAVFLCAFGRKRKKDIFVPSGFFNKTLVNGFFPSKNCGRRALFLQESKVEENCKRKQSGMKEEN